MIELTVALRYYVFDTPADRLIWDVGRQAYPHKILTGRRDRIRTLRLVACPGSPSAESEYDPFGAAHSSTSISAGLGMAVARDLEGKKNNVISVIGDGAMSAGMAYEAMNNAGSMNSRLIVILNDNDMSIAPPVGALSAYLARRVSGTPIVVCATSSARLPNAFPAGCWKSTQSPWKNTRAASSPAARCSTNSGSSTSAQSMATTSILLPVLKNVRDTENSPFLVHVVTQKGRGYEPAEKSADKSHGVVKFDVATGAQVKAKASAPAYQKVYGERLTRKPARTTRSSPSPRPCLRAPASTCSPRIPQAHL